MVYISREIEDEVKKWIDKKEIIAIRGTRQCGKTTLLKRLMGYLTSKRIPKEKIIFTSFEDDFEKDDFEKDPKEYIKSYIRDNKSKYFFLFDEVQYIKNAGKILKLIYDSFENVKIIITGSSTLDLNEIGSYLVGRVLLFEMYPFSFQEFLETKDKHLHNYYLNNRINLNQKIDIFKPLFLKELNSLLKEYITYGGYPAVVLEKNLENKKVLLKNIFLTYIEKDIVKVYGSKYKQRISDLIKYLSSINTSMLNYNEISGVISLYDKEVKDILHILEETYIIRLIKPYHKNLSTELKKNPKIYFLDLGLRNIIAGRFDFSEEEYGKLFENYVLLTYKTEKINYWRTTAKAEVDFIINENIPIESKTYPKITRSLKSYIDSYSPKIAYIVNQNEFKKLKINKTKVYFICFALI